MVHGRPFYDSISADGCDGMIPNRRMRSRELYTRGSEL